jgi:hypothetical protein
MEPRSDTRVESKGSYVRGLAAAIQREKLFDAVIARLDGDAKSLLLDPPPATAWISNDHIDRIHIAIADASDLAMCHRVGREAAGLGLVPVLEGFVAGALRLFGATPHTLFSRIAEINKLSSRGVTMSYAQTGERTGTLTLSYFVPRDVPDAGRHAISGALEVAFDLCRMPGGTIQPPPRTGPEPVVSLQLRASW